LAVRLEEALPELRRSNIIRIAIDASKLSVRTITCIAIPGCIWRLHVGVMNVLNWWRHVDRRIRHGMLRCWVVNRRRRRWRRRCIVALVVMIGWIMYVPLMLRRMRDIQCLHICWKITVIILRQAPVNDRIYIGRRVLRKATSWEVNPYIRKSTFLL